MVAKPTMPPRRRAMKQSATFSRQACLLGLSLIPPSEESRTGGAQKVTMWAKMDQTLHEVSFAALAFACPPGTSVVAEVGNTVAGIIGAGGLIIGACATPRSGRVSVFARLKVPAVRVGGGRLVGIGMSSGCCIGPGNCPGCQKGVMRENEGSWSLETTTVKAKQKSREEVVVVMNECG